MKREHATQNEIRNGLVDHGLFFRANVGRAWTGDQMQRVDSKRMLIINPRPFDTGLPAGFSDLFGARPVTITPDMVGQTVAVFSAIEVKRGKEKPRARQTAFLGAVDRVGGFSGVARSVADALQILRVSTAS